MEHVSSIRKHSTFAVWELNTRYGVPAELWNLEFSAVVLHYSLFSPAAYDLDPEFRRYLSERCGRSYKVAFFQDEFHFCRDRFAFLEEYEIDCVYTLLEQEYFEPVYGVHSSVPLVVSTIPGYVSDELRRVGRRFASPDEQRQVDVGYRARRVAAYMGREAQEKYEVGVGFGERAKGLGLSLDIAFGEGDRLYRDAWYRFIGGCKAMLGSEAGVATYDFEDKVYAEFARLTAAGREPTVDEMESGPIARWGAPIPNRVISPRHFEAAALGTCQLLFEGSYSGVMKPMVHYIPIAKDFSNFDEVIERFRDVALRRELVENARRDLIDSDDHSYQSFVAGFDQTLLNAGLDPEIGEAERSRVDRDLIKGSRRRVARSNLVALQERAREPDFPGKSALRRALKPALRRIDERWRRQDG